MQRYLVLVSAWQNVTCIAKALRLQENPSLLNIKLRLFEVCLFLRAELEVWFMVWELSGLS